MPQSAINSVMTQKMTYEHVQPDSFTPPLITSGMLCRNYSINYWRHLNHNLHKMKPASEPLISLKYKLTWVSEPVLQRPYPITMRHYDWVRSEINKLLDAQVICCSHSSWSAPILVVPKGDGGKCLVIDYRL